MQNNPNELEIDKRLREQRQRLLETQRKIQAGLQSLSESVETGKRQAEKAHKVHDEKSGK